MTGVEMKKALLEKTPVECRGIEYAYLSAIIYRAEGKEIVISGEMKDKATNSVTIARAADIKPAERRTA